jgi:type III secretion system low calcium response chaperone LcrH/SycD
MENQAVEIQEKIDNAVNTLDQTKLKKKDLEMIKKAISDVVLGGKPVSEVMGFKKDDINNFYLFGYNLFRGGKFDLAISMFTFLTFLEPNVGKYRFALAAAYHKKKDFKSAAAHYFAAAFIDHLNPLPYYYASDCFVEMGETDSAILALTSVIMRAEKDPLYEKILTRAQAMKEALIKNSKWNQKGAPPEEKK